MPWSRMVLLITQNENTLKTQWLIWKLLLWEICRRSEWRSVSNDESIYLFSHWTDPQKCLGQPKQWAGSQLAAGDFIFCLPAWDNVEIFKLFFVFLNLHLVPLGHDPVDFHEGFVLRLRNNKEDVNYSGEADGTEDEEAVGPQSSLRQWKKTEQGSGQYSSCLHDMISTCWTPDVHTS